MSTLADKIILFNQNLDYKGKLPLGIRIMNPFKDNPVINGLMTNFYKKFYNDNKPRRMILGINPGRFGGGVTGIPFTDTKRLTEFCGLSINNLKTHETSSVFVYDVINVYGGVKKFYSDFYINSVCPLGFTLTGENNKEKNYNYYDSEELFESAYGFIVKSIKQQLEFGFKNDKCFCMGNNANYKCLNGINRKEKFFKEIIPLEHPRYIMQYKLKKKNFYIKKYIDTLNNVSV